MNCLELHINDKIYKFENEFSVEGFNPSTDFRIINEFLAKGSMPYGWKVVSEDNKEVKFTEIFSELSEELKKRRSGEISEFEFPYNGNYSEDDIIRKLIGNGSLSECLQDYERDGYDLDHNVLYISGMVTASTWYGINSDRCVLITGNRFWSSDPKNRIIFDIYNELQKNNIKIINEVKSLYSKIKKQDPENVFKAMSFLVNNHLEEFCIKFFNPYVYKIKVDGGLTKATAEEFKGAYTIINGENKGEKRIAVFDHIGDENEALFKVATLFPILDESNKITGYSIGKWESDQKISEVRKRSFYHPFSVGNHILYGKFWYNIKEKSIVKPEYAIDDFRTMMYIGDKSFDLSELKLKVQDLINHKDIDLKKYDISLVTKTGVFKTNDNGNFVSNGIYVEPSDEIKMISFKLKEDFNLEKDQLHIWLNGLINNKKNVLTEETIRIFLYNILGDNVIINKSYDKEDTTITVQARDIAVDDSYVPKVVVNIGKEMLSKEDFITKLKHAISFWKRANEVDINKVNIREKHNSFRSYLEWLEPETRSENDFFESVYNGTANVKLKGKDIDDSMEDNRKNAILQAKPTKATRELVSRLIKLGMYKHFCSK